MGAGKSHLRERLLALGHAFEYLAAMGVFTVSRSRVFDKTMVISNGAAGMPYRNKSAIFGSKNWFRKTESELLRAYE